MKPDKTQTPLRFSTHPLYLIDLAEAVTAQS